MPLHYVINTNFNCLTSIFILQIYYIRALYILGSFEKGHSNKIFFFKEILCVFPQMGTETFSLPHKALLG